MNEDLLIQYLSHRCTPAEIRELDKWIAADQANADWLFEMERIWGLKDELRFSDKKEIETAYIRFISELQKKEVTHEPRTRSFSFFWIKYAVAAVLIGLLSVNIYIQLQDEPAQMNIVEVPGGQRVSLTLSDGTKVWLNSRTKFTYPTRFSSKERSVTLLGEGFFEVAHNEKSPFTVHVDLLKVKVLGTKFNVKAYENESSFVTLADGKVEVVTNDNEHKVTMKPDQQVAYSKKNGLVINDKVDTNVIKSWTLGEAAYINQRLDEIVNELERKFNVRIEITDQELSAEIFTCRFKETATIGQVMALLKDTRKLDYRIHGDQIKICNPTK